MTITVQSTSSINASTGVVMTGMGDQYWLLPGVNLVTDAFIGIRMSGGSSVVSIDGTVLSSLPAVQTDGADSYIAVGSTGVVRSTGASGPAVFMLGTANRLMNDGLVESVRDIAVFVQQSVGTVVNTGSIRAGLTGVLLTRLSNSLTSSAILENHGTIIGGASSNSSADLSAGVVVNAWATVVNFGTISSVSTAAGGGAGIGVYFVPSSAPSKVTTITNHGSVSSVRNWGIDASSIGFSVEPGLNIVNTGLISGYLGSIHASGFADILQNSGTLSGNVLMYDSLDRMVNTGEVLGDVNMGAGDDNFIGRLGSVTGVVRGDAGNDLLIGGAGDDEMAGGLDQDTLRGGDGEDSLSGNEGSDVIEGRAGDDSLSGGTGTDALFGGQGHDSVQGDDEDDLLYGVQGEDFLTGGNGNDTLYGGGDSDTLEGGALNDRLFGGSGDDSLDGGTESDVIEGGWGNDTLLGNLGADNLSGGAGADILRGGVARDTLAGGLDADIFVFASAAECGVGGTRDSLTDFLSGTDKLDISSIQTGMAFIGAAAFGNIAGQVRYVQATGLLSGDTNGDGIANFNLQLVAGTALLAGDFIF